MSKSIRSIALDILTRREHSGFELRRKLKDKGFDDETIAQLFADLTKENLLSDSRFAEAYVRMRANHGYGPIRIKQDLQERGVDNETISAAIDQHGNSWIENARVVRAKKFGDIIPKIFLERAKQMKYLQYKGFHLDDIKSVMRITELDV